ncbi:MAG: efflux RND transporter permease subunit [Arenimonas sp.]|uniref:efflux RND transporter permease subunit n=1 Tax=Arenimonas sp. TaxID=1872635 RepID=UPI0025BA2E47|nr:efflux RND transporter permease subunit [Arenimonas sp.]MBW8368294.1 efflux RND transporter permease subunit [Arenimonas sp.]
MGFEKLLRHGNLIAVAVLVLCILGTSAALRVPVQMIPDLEVRTISVQTRWAGATPQDVEQEILLEQEQYLRTLPNLSRMVSSASTGQASIELEFPFGVDINEALIRTSNALSQVSNYPDNVDQPSLSTSSFSDNAFMYFRIGARADSPVDLDLDMMRDYVEDFVRPRLERVEGVALVQVGGGSERQIRVEVDPARLAERGLTLAQVRDAVRARNRDTSGGDLDSGKRRYLLRTVGRVRDVAALEDVVLASRGDALVRLRDVASVRLDHFERRELSFNNGEPALSLSIRREPGSNVIAIKRAMLPAVDEVNRDLLAPLGLELNLSSDDARYVEDSVANVWTNLALGAGLATLVMFAFLRSRPQTLTGVIAIPISTIAAFVGLLIAGRTLNVISLAGVAFAIGMTVDNTIVVLESIDQARRRGLGRMESAIAGVRRVWPAVLASTLTTVMVFAPILFIQEEAGQLYSDIAIAISASILASLAVAVTVVPALAGRLAFGLQDQAQVPGQALFDGIADKVEWLASSARRRTQVLVGTVLFCGAALWWLTPPAEYLPEGEEPKTFARMIAPPGYNLAEMEGIARELMTELGPHVQADAAPFERGDTDMPPLAYYNLSASPGGLRIIAEPIDAAHIEATMDALDRRFLAYPGMRAFSSRGSIISSNDGGSRSINLDISGVELADLYAVAGRAYVRAEELFPGARVGSNPSSLTLDQPLVEVLPRWERLAEVGYDSAGFGFAVAALSDGAFVDELILGDDKVDIYLFGGAGTQQLDALREMPMATPSGAVLPLSALADLRESADTDTIRRLDGRRTVTLNIVPPRGIALETGVERVRAELVEPMRRAGEVPPDVAVDISGASDQLQATREAVSGNFAIALLLCYLLLVAIFQHWGRPLFVLATVPLGIAGGIIGLAILNLFVSQPFDVITLLGFLVLLGTVVNNPILIVDESYQRLQEGAASAAEAVAAAVRSRLRPILMSTATTLFGLAPLVLIPGAGTELYRGLGAIVLFGLAFSALVTLTFLPCLLVAVLGRRQRTAS